MCKLLQQNHEVTHFEIGGRLSTQFIDLAKHRNLVIQKTMEGVLLVQPESYGGGEDEETDEVPLPENITVLEQYAMGVGAVGAWREWGAQQVAGLLRGAAGDLEPGAALAAINLLQCDPQTAAPVLGPALIQVFQAASANLGEHQLHERDAKEQLLAHAFLSCQVLLLQDASIQEARVWPALQQAALQCFTACASVLHACISSSIDLQSIHNTMSEVGTAFLLQTS